jgi:hypothetical protein
MDELDLRVRVDAERVAYLWGAAEASAGFVNVIHSGPAVVLGRIENPSREGRRALNPGATLRRGERPALHEGRSGSQAGEEPATSESTSDRIDGAWFEAAASRRFDRERVDAVPCAVRGDRAGLHPGER